MYGKVTNFKMSYLMTYILLCYLLKFGDIIVDNYPYKYCKLQVAISGQLLLYEIHPLACIIMEKAY